MDANFYVTYGGKMKCNNAEVAGEIIAKSGSIGEGDNALKIAKYFYDSETQRNQYYLLYNRVFRVKGSDEGTATEPSVFIDGTIRAKSGQIGKTGNVDGEAMGTLFIEYAWYPWHLPSNNQGWDKLYLNKDAGRTKKYALYHRNFYITDDGEVAIGLDKRAKIYTKEGRIGDWVITTHELRDIKQHIVLDPADNTNPDNARASQIKLGHNPSNNTWNLRLIGDGSIEGPYWSIDAYGVATFSNSNNTYNGASYSIGNGNSWTAQGFTLEAGQKLQIGNCTLQTFENGNGFRFDGKIQFDGETNFSRGDLKIHNNYKVIFDAHTSLGSNGLSIDNGNIGVTTSGLKAGSDITISTNGTSNGLNLVSSTCKIDSKAIGTYIEDIVKTIVSSYISRTSVSVSYSTSQLSSLGDSDYVITAISGGSLTPPA